MKLNDLQRIAPLPDLGKYTISEDFANLMINEIIMRRPLKIVEAGSGVSTVLIGYCMRFLGQGSLCSLEHLEHYQKDTIRLIKHHKLQDLDIKVHFSPLKNYDVNNKIFPWYSLSSFDHSQKIDMLIIDGPPRITGKLARYPALPLLYKQLSESAVIFLDDTKRIDETEILRLWCNEYPNLKIKLFNTQKGAALIKTC